jgi:NAD(P)-dependent dehydrogenase (short-subunit alcohol dehydrogenase family)
MLDRGYGRIIKSMSLAAFVGLFQVAAYNASKAASQVPNEVLGRQVVPRGVLVNAIPRVCFGPRSMKTFLALA